MGVEKGTLVSTVVAGEHDLHPVHQGLPPPTGGWRRGAAAAVAVVIAGLYISIPLAVLAGMLQ